MSGKEIKPHTSDIDATQTAGVPLPRLKRRDFLRMMGWGTVGVTLAGCDLPSTVTLEEGEETVVSYLSPEEYVIPGVGVWYASICLQCPAGCGIHGRVREGRALKLEGNPESPVNRGKLCQMGQAGVQAHYNPDRLRGPQARKDGKLVDISWDEAWQLLGEKVGAATDGARVAWFTGTISGHQAALVGEHLSALGSTHQYAHEAINNAVGRAVNQDMLGEAAPGLVFDKAKLIVSFGADFLGTWVSPVHFATEYGKFRAGQRGVLVVAEPKMSLTGANADLWLAVRPGTEGVLALGIAHVLMQSGVTVPEAARAAVEAYAPAKAAEITGVSVQRIEQIAALLQKNSPSLVLAGATVEGQEQGYQAASAIMLLNIMLDNVGQTIVARGAFPFPQLAPRPGNTRDLVAFTVAAKNKALDVAIFCGTNPVYTAPAALGLTEGLQNIPFKVVLAQVPDETAMQADLLLPVASTLEDWGTHVAEQQAEQGVITFQQPLMENLYPGVPGVGDVLLKLLKLRVAGNYDAFADYYAYLQSAIAALPDSYKEFGVSNQQMWEQTLQKGLLKVESAAGSLTTRVGAISLSESTTDAEYPLRLIPSPRLGLWDGRHANIPWLQEAPDQISKVVWDSWAEIHPTTAAKLGVQEGDVLEIASAHGSLKVKAYLFKGVHPDAIAVPLGQGHDESFGRFARMAQGVNPLKIVGAATEAHTGELALYGTPVKATRTGVNEQLVKEGYNNISQRGQKMVATISADQFRRTEGA
ncbi:MAG: molybdopterin-dependent oxidoreductase [Gammaproteobacteria bacterium]|nr:molybdopterin-dependent oxidoreductase [Gammaproteobacteria bacterium]